MVRSGRSATPYLLGIDLGTSRLKLQVIDGPGTPIAEATGSIQMQSSRPGYAEQDPGQWWEALAGACRTLFSGGVDPSRIETVGVSGQMHGAVLLGAGGEVLRPCLTWADGRATEQIAQIGRDVPLRDLIAITGNAPNTGFTASKLLWVRQHEPRVYARARQVLLPKDYLRYRLTGAYATDVSDASATLMFDLARRDWSPTLLDALGIDLDLLPQVHESAVVVGQVTPDAAATTGLTAGIPVVAGGGDAPCAALGLGLTGGESSRGAILASVGTSGQVFAVTGEPVVDPQGRVHSLCYVLPGRWQVMGAILSGGIALDWLRDLLTPRGGPAPEYDDLETGARSAGVGAGGVIFLPYLMGERTPHMDSDATALFFGLRLHHTQAHLARAVMEGVAFALRDGLEVMREMGIQARELRPVGGGARLPLWREIQRDVLALPARVDILDHGAAHGAALLAAVGVGLLDDLDALFADRHTGELSLPDAAAVVEYERIFSRYRALYPALRGV